jgi:hypothetical protein
VTVASLRILTANDLKALDSLERQAARRAARQQPLVRLILRAFLERGGPIRLEDLTTALPDGRADMLREALLALDDEDLIRFREGLIDIAYPFAAAPTPFRLRLRDGRERYACCAMDALGIAPMVGEAIEIRSSCYHCGAALTLSATPDGPGPESHGMMATGDPA